MLQSVVGKGLHWGIVPLCAIVGAGSTNVYLSRKNEIDQGIGLRASREMKGEVNRSTQIRTRIDADRVSQPLATSHVAGSKAVLLTIMSRALIPGRTVALQAALDDPFFLFCSSDDVYDSDFDRRI